MSIHKPRVYYVDHDGEITSLTVESAVRVATMVLMGKDWNPSGYGRVVKAPDPKSRLVFSPTRWSVEDWKIHLGFIKALLSPRPGRPYIAPGDLKRQRSVRISDHDLAFIESRGFTLQKILDHAIWIERQMDRN